MKKNITINLFGSLYATDEDAYELLNQYQNNMRRYFSRKEGGEEIAEDIERRIAELFDELKASGVEAITIEHVRDIIHASVIRKKWTAPKRKRLPTKQMMPQRKANAKKTYIRKLFRNPDDKMLGGVTSGLACYFGIDPLWLRLLMILFAWFSLGTSIIIYLILWIIIPEAWTRRPPAHAGSSRQHGEPARRNHGRRTQSRTVCFGPENPKDGTGMPDRPVRHCDGYIQRFPFSSS